LHFGHLGSDGFHEESIKNSEILALAARTRYVVDPEEIPRRNFKGWVIVKTKDGRQLERIEFPWTKGHHENPTTPDLVRRKFQETAGKALDTEQVARIIEAVDGINGLHDIGQLITLCIPAINHSGK